MIHLDIIIPVYNEGKNIISVLDSLKVHVKTPFRVLICYDRDTDDTLPVIRDYKSNFLIDFVKNEGRGVADAVLTGFKKIDSKAIIVIPADDNYNAPIIDKLYKEFESGAEIVVPSRFMKGGCMKGCPLVKAFLVRSASWTLRFFAALPVADASNGFRLFSRKVIEQIPIETNEGFVYSLELLVKCHRLGWPICEIPSQWFERVNGRSRFHIFKWAKRYLRWYFYAFETTYFRKKPETVKLRYSV